MILKRYPDLTAVDFRHSSIWRNVHGQNEQESWYNDVDEVTYRPWDRPTPLRLEDNTLPDTVVAANFYLANGRTANGFLSPPMSDGGFGDLQPQVFDAAGREFFSLYHAVQRLAEESVRRLERHFACPRADIFPLRFSVSTALVVPLVSGVAEGVYYREAGRELHLT